MSQHSTHNFIEDFLPKQPMFGTRELWLEYKLFSKSMLHKLIGNGEIDAVMIGKKYFIPRAEIVDYFNRNLVSNKEA